MNNCNENSGPDCSHKLRAICSYLRSAQGLYEMQSEQFYLSLYFEVNHNGWSVQYVLADCVNASIIIFQCAFMKAMIVTQTIIYSLVLKDASKI